MMQEQEIVVGTIGAQKQDERLELLCGEEAGEYYVALRSAQWGKGIGWYPQRTIRLAPEQIALLLTLLKRANGFLSSSRKRTLKLRESKGRPSRRGSALRRCV